MIKVLHSSSPCQQLAVRVGTRGFLLASLSTSTQMHGQYYIYIYTWTHGVHAMLHAKTQVSRYSFMTIYS